MIAYCPTPLPSSIKISIDSLIVPTWNVKFAAPKLPNAESKIVIVSPIL